VLSALQRGAHRDPEWTRGECRRAADDLHESSAEEIDDEDHNVNARRDAAQPPGQPVFMGASKGVIALRPYQPSARRVYQPAALP
jgi:hypothetical protein